jgi:biopolymer transport protein ExbB
MYVLYALSFLSVFLIFYYFFSLRKEVIAPNSLVKEFEEKKKDLEVMGRICAEDDSPLAKIIGAGVETLRKQNSTYAMVKDAVEDEGSRQSSLLWQRIQYLQDIVVVAPMVGLLGTVQGMIQSFGALYAENMTPKPTLIAHGVAMALITTAAGLVIAILSMIVYSYFRGRVNLLISDLESASSRISRELIRLSAPEKDDQGAK